MTGAVILAAGKGTRLRSSTAKVLHRLAGRSLLSWVVHALAPLELDRIVVVVGHQADDVAAEARAAAGERVVIAHQPVQDGTGGAVAAAAATGALDDLDEVLVLPGDVPVITPERLDVLRAARGEAAAAVLTTTLDDPTGYGRIVTDDAGSVRGIVEHADATEDQLAIAEVNTAIFAFRGADLLRRLGDLGDDNAQGEVYLTDIVELLVADDVVRRAVALPEEVLGINDLAQMAEVEEVLRRRILRRHMLAGVRILDPASTHVEADVEIDADATILPGTMLEAGCVIAAEATVGPYSRLRDTRVGRGATVAFTVATDAVVGHDASVGPYTHLRPGTVLGPRTKAGGFVEVKKSVIGEGSKVPHLSYVGDATIGEGVNLGAGTVTVNYDGFAKHHTTIGDDAFIGSDSMLVAPIEIGSGAFVGAGSTVTTDVPSDALVVERAQPRTIEGWAARRRARHDAQANRDTPVEE